MVRGRTPNSSLLITALRQNALRLQPHPASEFAAAVDLRFVDAAHDDYRLRPDSPALRLGFQPIPINRKTVGNADEIGRREVTMRAGTLFVIPTLIVSYWLKHK